MTIDSKHYPDGSWRDMTIPVRNISGRHAVYLTFTSNDANAVIADLRAFAFTRDTP